MASGIRHMLWRVDMAHRHSMAGMAGPAKDPDTDGINLLQIHHLPTAHFQRSEGSGLAFSTPTSLRT